jgi:hypothetical protein
MLIIQFCAIGVVQRSAPDEILYLTVEYVILSNYWTVTVDALIFDLVLHNRIISLSYCTLSVDYSGGLSCLFYHDLE